VTTKGEHRDAQVHLVTTARRPHSEEISGRARRYLISMGIRTVCLVLAIFVLDGWLRLIAIAAAIVLPWFAVVLANAGPVIDDESPEYVTITRPEIEERKPDDAGGAAAAPPPDQTAQHRSA
jgi:hypothetical protein